MTDRYERIREALEMGPTPGPWVACPANSRTFVKSRRLAGYLAEVRNCRTAQDANANAHLIAACDPGTLRALLEERDALVAENERLSDALRGWWKAHRPVGWTEKQHRFHPHVNLATSAEKALADAMLRARETSND